MFVVVSNLTRHCPLVDMLLHNCTMQIRYTGTRSSNGNDTWNWQMYECMKEEYKWALREQHSHSSGALQICAFAVFLALEASSIYFRQSKQDCHTCSRQCWSFPCPNDGNIAWNFPHIDILPRFTFPLMLNQCLPSSLFRYLSATLPTSHQPWRNRCVASLLWTYVMCCFGLLISVPKVVMSAKICKWNALLPPSE